jgi:hypothetical protein
MNGYNLVDQNTLHTQQYYPWWWKYGGPVGPWIDNLVIVENTIRTLNLTPLNSAYLPNIGFGQQPFAAGAQLAQGVQTQAGKIIPEVPHFPGGLKCPHLHYKREIYLLTNDQWKIFSKSIIDNFKDKLSSIQSISFENLLQLSESLSGLG